MSVRMVVQNKSDKQAIAEWEELLLSLRQSTPVNTNETPAEKAARIKRLEKPGNEEEWFAYYFPKYCFSKPAKFQIESTKRIMKRVRAGQGIYQSRKWARGLSKSTRRMFEVFYIKFALRVKLNAILISKTETNAARLLDPYRANLEANQRLINDYGKQQRPGKWSEFEFITRDGSSFRACGAEQNPRGAKLEEMRVNLEIFDDVDDDEVCRNVDRVETRWAWIERAVIPTVDIARPYWIFFDNNVIAEDSLAVRAAQMADDNETVNIRDSNGESTWPEKNSEEVIDRILSKISYESQQTEYFNNPMQSGKAFPQITYGKCPHPSKLQFIQIYADPATSNKDKPLAKSKNSNSSKAVWVTGWDGHRLYVYYGFLGVVNNSTFIDWLYSCYEWATRISKAQVCYVHIENNTLQDPFYQQVFIPLITQHTKERGYALPVVPDGRQKPDKWFRIEANLEPLNRNGNLIFNQDEANNPHLKALEAQFKSAKATSRALDGPDCIEGAYHLAKERYHLGAAPAAVWGRRAAHSKRF